MTAMNVVVEIPSVMKSRRELLVLNRPKFINKNTVHY